MEAARAQDVDWRHGRSWSLVYYAGDEHTDFLKKVYSMFFSENGLSPTAFPSLQKFEKEVVAMVLDLLGATGKEVGTMTSGGTESILLAMRAYRDRTRDNRPEIKDPEILVPTSAHPAFLKAAKYFDLKAVPVPLDKRYKADVDAIRNLYSDQTICVVASAPSFPQGVVDPIPEIAAMTESWGIGLHVDACLGGFLLPFIRNLGYEFPAFDFNVPGVTSISTDLHKNGYTAKGASAVLYRDPGLRRYQFFVSADWPGGLYGSPTMAGTRPGGAIASAWAALMSLGMSGYSALAKVTMETTKELIEGIRSIDGLDIIAEPEMNVFSFGADHMDIFALGDRMDSKGWRLDRQNNPACLHMIATSNHKAIVQEFLVDLEESVNEEKRAPTPKGRSEAMLYGVTANAASGRNPEEVILTGLEKLYTL